MYPTLPVASSSNASTPSRPSIGSAAASPLRTSHGQTATPAKTPLFRATSAKAESEDDDDEGGAADDDYGRDASPNPYEAQGGDSGDELAQQLMQKATLDASPRSKGKGKDVARERVPVEDEIAPALQKPPTPPAPPPNEPVIVVHASLHLYDRATGLFMLQEDSVKAGLYKVPPPTNGHWLVVESDSEGDVWVSQAVTGSTTVNFAEKERAMVFNYTAPAVDEVSAPETYTWLLRLSDEEAFTALQAAVSAALFEDKWGAGSWNKMKDDDREYARKAWLEEDVEMWDAEEAEAEAEEDAEEGEEEEEEEEDEPLPESGDDEDTGESESQMRGVRLAWLTGRPPQTMTTSGFRPRRKPSLRKRPNGFPSAQRSEPRTARSLSDTRTTFPLSCKVI